MGEDSETSTGSHIVTDVGPGTRGEVRSRREGKFGEGPDSEGGETRREARREGRGEKRDEEGEGRRRDLDPRQRD